MAAERATGSPRVRREDPALITGDAQFTDDFITSGAAHAAVVRSQYGHARIIDIETNAAEAMTGVIQVFTAADVAESGIKGTTKIGGPVPTQRPTEFPILAKDRARYAGEPIAVVLAEDKYTARNAANQVHVEYERLPALITVDDALADEAPVLHDEYPDNQAFDWKWGDHDAVDDAFSSASHIVELDVENNRLVPNAIEARGIVADYDHSNEFLSVTMSTQVPHRAREYFAEPLDLDVDQIRVKAPAVGGGYGSKNGTPYPEEPLAAWCSMQLQQPVKWQGTRSESFHMDHQGRGVRSHGELALDSDGKILAVRVSGQFNLGGYLGWQITPAFNFHHQISSLYDIPFIAGHFIGAFTNTTPVGPFRGAGTPNAIILISRLIDQAAAELEIDPAAIRRRNFIQPDDFPFETATGTEYDSGNYPRALEKLLELSGYAELREKQQTLREDDRFLGIGIGGFTKKTGVNKKTGLEQLGAESNRVLFDDAGALNAYCSTTDHGQGHSTTFGQLLTDELGISYDDIRIIEGDTNDLPTGQGTFGCRSTAIGGSTLVLAAEKIIEQARQLAAVEFEASPKDVDFDDGEFKIAGAGERSIDLQTLAKLSYTLDELPDGVSVGFESSATFDPGKYMYAFGLHIAVVEVAPESGEIDLQDYYAVDDVGNQINPLLVDGQIIGGIGQGIGEALFEEAVWNDTGSLVTASFTDYALPRAMHIPEITLEQTVTPCPHTPTGAKGAGENGCLGAPPAIMNAVVDAVRPFGIDHLHHPITPETVWQSLQ